MTLTYRTRVRTSDLRFARWRLVVLAMAVGCLRDPIAAPKTRSAGSSPAAAKSSTALAVTSTSPAFGDQGTTVDVHVFGSGFVAGAQATWLLSGVADSHVHTNSTTYISSSELVANITIANGAQLAFWDVQVSLSNGKNGVGSDLFEVTSAQILGTTGGYSQPYAMSQDFQVVGWASGGGGAPFVYNDAVGMVSLGKGQAWSIDPWGSVIGGRDTNLVAIVWVRQSSTSWVAEQLPRLPFSNGGNAMGAARTPDGTLLVAGFDDSVSSAKPTGSQFNRPVVWQRSSTGWSAPQRYLLPAGAVKGSARAINGSGQAAGGLDGGVAGVVWDNPTTPTRLDGKANAINAAGTLVAGEQTVTSKNSSNSIPAYWWRDPVTGVWTSTGTVLPSIVGASCPYGSVEALNGAGILVGNSCNAAGQLEATVWRLDLSGPTPVLVAGPLRLSGLGPNSKSSEMLISSAESISESTPFTIAGTALDNGIGHAIVRWLLVMP